MLVKQNFLSLHGKNEEVDIFYPNSFVVQLSVESVNLATTKWASTSAMDILNTNGVSLSYQNLNNFLPKCIRDGHEKIMKRFYKTGHLSFSYAFRDLWMVTFDNALFSSRIFNKLLYEQKKLSFLTYVQKIDDSSLMILSKNGEINCFGSHLHELLGVKHAFFGTVSNPSVFISLPQLIPFFLPHFYDLPSFKLEVGLIEL